MYLRSLDMSLESEESCWHLRVLLATPVPVVSANGLGANAYDAYDMRLMMRFDVVSERRLAGSSSPCRL